MSSSSNSSNSSTYILWATQSGRAKACARRTLRLLQSSCDTSIGIGDVRGRCAFDDMDFLSLGGNNSNNDDEVNNNEKKRLLLLFVSTTGDAELPTSITKTWQSLLSKSLPPTFFSQIEFALFALGDRAYGPDAFCAAGRKLATRLVQLGAKPVCKIGYGDDGSLNGGVLADLDGWLEGELFPYFRGRKIGEGMGVDEELVPSQNKEDGVVKDEDLPYTVRITPATENKEESSKAKRAMQEWQTKEYQQYYCKHFAHSRPTTAYQYDKQLKRITNQSKNVPSGVLNNDAPLLGRVTVNERITAEDWMQDTRHLMIHVVESMDSEQSPMSEVDDATRSSMNGPNNESESTILPYQAGDVATILPSNPPSLVTRSLSVLPPSIQSIADDILHIEPNPSSSTTTTTAINHPWPNQCTLRSLLTHCADLQSLPEREDLFALSSYCHPSHATGREQTEKLISLSETAGAALYGDYIIREKRNWVDVFYDFDSLCWEDKNAKPTVTDMEMENCNKIGENGAESLKQSQSSSGSLLTIAHLLAILPSISPRHFSIASSPSYMKQLQSSASSSSSPGKANKVGFELELCVAVVEGTTPLGRSYTGCCSKYLASIVPRNDATSNGSNSSIEEEEGSDMVRLWIHPGSFAKLPLNPMMNEEEGQVGDGSRHFETPVMCIGAGTGIAPLRSLILEREAKMSSQLEKAALPSTSSNESNEDLDNILVFGCRKKTKDYYYASDWTQLTSTQRLRLISAFSRDQTHKLYVQRALREADNGELIAKHLLERGGAIYIAGGSKMARAVKDEIVEALATRLEGGEKDAKKLLGRLKRKGLFSIEAWS